MLFKKIAILDRLDVVENTLVKVGELTSDPVFLPSEDPKDSEEILSRAEGSEAVIATWRTKLDEAFFSANPQLKFVAMAASAFVDPSKSSIDLIAAARHGVVVSALGQYGDEATAEWVLATMLNSAHHIYGPPWRKERTELFGKRLGIVGLSHVGTHVASRASAFGMEAVYSSRAPKDVPYERLGLNELLATSDIVSVHIAKGVQIMDASNFTHLPVTTLLINTSIGDVMEPAALDNWLARGGSCLGDATVSEALAEVMMRTEGGWVGPLPAADTTEMHQRRSDQLVEALAAYLQGSPVRVVTE